MRDDAAYGIEARTVRREFHIAYTHTWTEPGPDWVHTQVTSVMNATTIIMLTAFIVRAAPLLPEGAIFHTLEYDDGVYYAASAHLIRGELPYRDFVFVQPPGITILLLPFVALAGVIGDVAAMATARLAIAVVGSVNSVLIYFLLRKRAGDWAIFAGLFYAVWRVPAQTERTILLEPFVTLFWLTSILLLSRVQGVTRKPFAFVGSGMLMGLAVATKLWAVPLLALLFSLVFLKWRLRLALAWTVGACAGAFICLPLVVHAPMSFVQQVFLNQLGRASPDSLLARLLRFTDIGGLGVVRQLSTPILAVAAVAALCSIAVCCYFAWKLPWARLYVVILTLQLLEITVAPVYYYHYFAFAAAAMAITFGAAGASLRPEGTNALMRFGGGVTLSLLGLASIYHPAATHDEYSRLKDFVNQHQCVWFSTASYAITADVLSRQIDRGCPMTVDTYGILLNTGSEVSYDSTVEKEGSIVLQQRIAHEFRTSDAVVIRNLGAAGLSDFTRRLLQEEFVLVGERGGLMLWSRT